MSSIPAATIQAPEAPSISAWRLAARKLWRHRLGRPGLIFIAIMAATAVLAPLIAPYDPATADFNDILSPPSWAHPFGTDNIGRDVMSRVIWGAQISLQVIVLSIIGAIFVGAVVGMISGYVGGWLDHLIMRIVDGMLAFPMLILALAIVSVLGPDLINAIIAITIVNIPGFARLVRGQVLSVRQLDYVQAAKCVGNPDWRIMFFHIWPMVVGNVIVYGSLRASVALITESTLAFLGLGAQPPTPSWGSMLTTAMQYFDAWWLSTFPGAAIFLGVLSLNFLGDGLRDALDAKLPE